MNDPAKGPAGFSWLFGLAIKAAVVASVAILAFDAVRPRVIDWAYETFLPESSGRPTSDQTKEVMTRVAENPGAIERDEDLRDELDQLVSRMREYGMALFVVDPGGKTLYRSADLETVQADLIGESHYHWRVGDEDRGVVFVSYTPLSRDERIVGLLGRVSFYDDLVPPDDTEDHPVMTTDPASPMMRDWASIRQRQALLGERFERIRDVTGVAISIVIAVVLGGLVSFFATRRIRRLAREAESTDTGELPGPFSVRGRDEIGSLARVLNNMRGRIEELVGGLREQDRSRREWIAQVSHDLRTPLTSLEICLRRLARDVASEDTSTEEKTERELATVELALHDCRRLQSLSDDLLEIARLEAGNPLSIEPILPRELIREACRSAQPLAEERGLSFDVGSEPSDDREVVGDGPRLLRACENLIRNAIRHAAASVRVRVEFVGRGVRFSVRDDGPGFGGAEGPVDLEQIMARGSQADSTGLGLLVAHRIAEAHGGIVGADNEASGTHVWFEIPVAPAP